METTVIHIRDAPYDWPNNPQYVYIGRAGQGFSGVFGNPFKTIDHRVKGAYFSREESLRLYSEWLDSRIAYDKDFRKKVKGLYNKTLVCFCKPRACHGDYLKLWAISLNDVRENQ